MERKRILKSPYKTTSYIKEKPFIERSIFLEENDYHELSQKDLKKALSRYPLLFPGEKNITFWKMKEEILIPGKIKSWFFSVNSQNLPPFLVK